MAELDDRYTKDGTTDLKGNPSVKKDTGTWKACPYILGIYLSPFTLIYYVLR
jgi:solute carrier family 15 (peptide/histidine transporter), member 3/4